MVYKWCIVPLCKNTSIKTPEKVFISVPSNATLRKKWLELAQIPKDSNSLCSFYCEDHFNMEKDVANYMQYKMGYSKKIRMADGALPSKFDCQHDPINNITDSNTTKCSARGRRKDQETILNKNIEPNEQKTSEVEGNMFHVKLEPPEDNNRLLEVEVLPCTQIKIEPYNDIDVGESFVASKSMSLNKETMQSVVKQEPLDINDSRLLEIEVMPSIQVKVEPDKDIDVGETVLYKPESSTSAPNSYKYYRKPPKTASQRQKEYRERKKRKKATVISKAKTAAQYSREYRERVKMGLTPASSNSSNAKTGAQRSKEYRERKKINQFLSDVNSNRKTTAQRCKEYRERKKTLGLTDETNRKRCSDFRQRLKLRHLEQISTTNPSTNNCTSFIKDSEMPRKVIKSPKEDCIADYNSPQGLDMSSESHFANDQIDVYSNYDQHCSGHIDFINNFKNNSFGHSCAVCDRLWWQRDLKASSAIHDNILQIIVPNYVTGSTVQVCSSCKLTLDKQKIPILSTFNGFSYPTLPSHLPTLDIFSQRLISPRLPFMQVRRLRHVHNDIYPQIINVPLSVNTMVTQLPRNVDDDYCLYMNIKNKLIHKTSHVQGLINKRNIKEWLTYLVETPLYIHYNITIDDSLFNIDDDYDTEFNIDDISEHVTIEESLTAQQQTLMFNENQMFNIAVGANRANIPPSIFDENAEELSFPTLYGGQFRKYSEGLHVTSFMQANSELRRTDRRGAEPQHLLYIAMKIIRERVKDALKNITKEQLQSLETNVAFLRCIPNSDSYWADRKKDLFAIMRQKGAPTAFITLAANETGWKDLLKLLYTLNNHGADITDEQLAEMSHIHKATLVNEDDVTCAIYFSKLLNCLLHTLQAKKRSPFGRYRVLDYFRRIDFQDRGSPQAHIFLWLDNAPANILSNDADVIKMVDELVSVSAPEASGNIKFQTHRHTFTCYKKTSPREKQNCKFGAPFMPSRQTVTLLPMKHTDDDYCEENLKKYKDHYNMIRSNLENFDYTDFNHFYTHNNIESDLHYNNILRAGIDLPKLFHKRTPSEKWHIPFNPFVLYHLQSSMDFQIIQDEHACAAYIVEYFNTNKNVSNLQRQIVETINDNPEFDIEQITKELSVDVFNSVEMSSQEAAWYLLREPMAKSSIVTVYLPTIHRIERQRIRKSMKDFNEIDDDYTDIWKENWFDAYETRPDNLNDVTLAKFVSNYCKNKKGGYSERKEPRVIRYRHYDKAEHFNDYRREMVLLHIAYRNEDNDVLAENKFVQLYEYNKDLILQRRKEFERKDIAKTLEICRQLYTDAEEETEVSN